MRDRWINVLANLPLFDRASSASIETLIQNTSFAEHAVGAVIYGEGTTAHSVFFLIEGAARVFQSDNGAQYTPKLFSAPTHFGDLANLARLGVYQSSVQAMTAAITARVPFATIEQLLESDHGLCLSWLRSVARQHSVTIDSDRQSVFGGLPARLANTLLSYGDVFGTAERGQTAIEHALSYTQIAQHAGCSRRGAITAMQTFTKRGLVRAGGGRWIIDGARLRGLLIPGRLSLAYSLASDSDGEGK